ncbi:MAG: PIG-L family deacetylase [Ardenticatenaceae bacterium]|nr:PIG-L family deacetylase [Ardenticatenaceae bacterium]
MPIPHYHSPLMNNKRILALFAHPDDEIIGPGGTFAHYAAAGVRIEAVYATRGEAGEISDPTLATPETLGEVREQEMLCAAQALGFQKVHFLGYRDSGMAGTTENQHPNAYINAPDEAVLAQLVPIIRAIRPHLIITFEPYGGYGHPDHLAIHKHALAAYTLAADPTYQPELGTPWQTPRLFYDVLMMSFFDRMMAHMQAHGIDTTQMESNFTERRVKGWPEGKVTCTLDVSATVDAKFAAYRCHRTQFGPDGFLRQLPEAEMKRLQSQEYFYLARPEQPGLVLTDLFEGIDIE